MMRSPTMKIYLQKKYIDINRPTIKLLDNPPYLNLLFDRQNARLILLPAFEETLDTYEIPQYYWNDTRQTCHICRLPLFLALQEMYEWKNAKIYVIKGVYQFLEEKQKLVVFNLDEAVEMDIKKHTPKEINNEDF